MSKKQALLTLLCCLVGIGTVAVVFVFGVRLNTPLFILLLLLCPLSHLLMMEFMSRV